MTRTISADERDPGRARIGDSILQHVGHLLDRLGPRAAMVAREMVKEVLGGGGTLEIDSGPDVGTTVWKILPVRQTGGRDA